MRNSITFILVFQTVALSLLITLRIKAHYEFRKRQQIRKLIEISSQPLDESSRVEQASSGSLLSQLTANLLKTTYGRWFAAQCIRAGYWSEAETAQMIRWKFQLFIAGIILAQLGISLWNLSILNVVLLPVIGFLIVDYVVSRKGEERSREIAEALPETIDLLNMTVGAGLGFQAGLDRISRTETNPLRNEFRRVLSEIRMGASRTHAFTSMADRIRRPEVSSFTSAILQVDKLGIPLTSVLRDQAKVVRADRREKARERAQKLPVKILAPIMLFLLPAILIIVLAPAIMSIATIF